MKKTKSPKKLPYIDYECQVGERIQWRNILDESFEGVIVSWSDDDVVLAATVKLDDGSLVVVPC